MNWEQWDAVWAPSWGKDHPGVILTPTPFLGKQWINFLPCTTLSAGRARTALTEIILDEADGLENPTLCKLVPIFVAEPQELSARWGRVCVERRRLIGQRLAGLYRLLEQS